jgi:hypothetical protein
MLGQGIMRSRMGASPHSKTLSFMIVSPSSVNKNKIPQDLWRWGGIPEAHVITGV